MARGGLFSVTVGLFLWTRFDSVRFYGEEPLTNQQWDISQLMHGRHGNYGNHASPLGTALGSQVVIYHKSHGYRALTITYFQPKYFS